MLHTCTGLNFTRGRIRWFLLYITLIWGNAPSNTWYRPLHYTGTTLCRTLMKRVWLNNILWGGGRELCLYLLPFFCDPLSTLIYRTYPCSIRLCGIITHVRNDLSFITNKYITINSSSLVCTTTGTLTLMIIIIINKH